MNADRQLNLGDKVNNLVDVIAVFCAGMVGVHVDATSPTHGILRAITVLALGAMAGLLLLYLLIMLI